MKPSYTLFLLIILIFSTCSNDDDIAMQTTGDTLDPEELESIDSIGMTLPSLSEIYGYDGNTLGRIKEFSLASLKNKMIIFVQEASKLTAHDEASPNQLGLAYSFGQRDISQRLTPKAGNDLHKADAVWGTDCSGLMILMFNSVGVPLDKNTSVAGKTFEPNLKKAVAQTNKENGTNFIVKNIGFKVKADLKPGDILLWKSHVGIYVDSKKGASVFQSNGTGSPTDSVDQKKNYSDRTKRGVHPIHFDKMITMKYPNGSLVWGDSYSVLRLTENDSYTLRLKCKDNASNRLIIDLKLFFSGTAVNGGGLGRYLNGDSAVVAITGTYNKTANSISGKLTVADISLVNVSPNDPSYTTRIKEYIRFDIITGLIIDKEEFTSLTLDPSYYDPIDPDDDDITPCPGEVRLIKN